MLTNDEKWAQVRARHAAKIAATTLSPQPTVCPYRGECVRLVECDSCSGRILIKVFNCSKEPGRECTASKAIAGIHVCDG